MHSKGWSLQHERSQSPHISAPVSEDTIPKWGLWAPVAVWLWVTPSSEHSLQWKDWTRWSLKPLSLRSQHRLLYHLPFVTLFGGPELLQSPSNLLSECSLAPNFFLLPLSAHDTSWAFSVSGTSKCSCPMFSSHRALCLSVTKDDYILLYKLEFWLSS